MRKYLFMGFIMMLVLTGCAEQEMSGAAQSDLSLNNKSVRGNHAEVPEGDFVYRLVSEKEQYESGDQVQVYGELEYVGEQAEITIGHAASVFYFPMQELTRDYDISYGMNEPYITTTLKKGEPLREYYNGGGGYDAGDDKKFKDFIHSLRDGFPDGQYVVYGSADFVIHPGETDSAGSEPQSYKIQAEIEFKVNDKSQ